MTNDVVQRSGISLTKIVLTIYVSFGIFSRFLFELRAVEENTKMNLGNLATVFGPILLRPTVIFVCFFF